MNLITQFLAWLEKKQSFPNSPMSKLQKLHMLKSMKFNTFDIDGVIQINDELGGIYPGPDDVIITGRSYEEAPETYKLLDKRGITNVVFFNPLPFNEKTRQSSGVHKGTIINGLIEHGCKVGCHFEDDQVQAAEINKLCPNLPVILIGSNNYTVLENIRHVI